MSGKKYFIFLSIVIVFIVRFISLRFSFFFFFAVESFVRDKIVLCNFCKKNYSAPNCMRWSRIHGIKSMTFDGITDISFPTKGQNEHFTSTFLPGFCRFHYIFGHFRIVERFFSRSCRCKNCNHIKWDLERKQAWEATKNNKMKTEVDANRQQQQQHKTFSYSANSSNHVHK